MRGDLLLALDLGTTGVCALVVGGDGAVRARAHRTLGVAFPAPGRVEQDPGELWEASVEVLRRALREARADAGDVAGLGVVAQRATALAWDAASGEPLAPALGWQDQRTEERVGWFRERGIPLTTLASATKFEWLVQRDAAVARAAAGGRLRLGTPDAWLTYKLSGGEAHVTDPGNASCTALYDLAGGGWAAPLLELFGLDQKWLPSLAASAGVVGETPARLLGGPVAVAARAGDQQAAAFAQGAHASGEAKLTLGTSAMLDLHTGAEPVSPSAGTFPLALWQLGDGERAFCLEGTVVTAGAAVDWLVSLGLAADGADVDRLARSVASTGGVAFVPALQGLGTPFLDDAARGLIAGLSRGSGAPELARAVLEGIAQRCVDVLEALEVPPGALRVDGGLARSELLLQALADLGGRDVVRAAETETTALGAAFLAGLASGVFADPAACRAVLPAGQRFTPARSTEERAAKRAAWARVLAHARSGDAGAGPG